MNFIRKIIGTLLFLLSIVSSITLLASAYIQYYSPEKFPLPALLGLAFPVFVLTTALLFIALLIIFPRFSIVPLLSLALSFPALQQYCPINKSHESIDTNRDTFTLLSYNVYHFVDTKNEPGYEESNYNRIMQDIINADADIVAIQEGHGYWGVNKYRKVTREQIDRIEEMYPYHTCENRSRILSKYPIELLCDTLYTGTANTSVYKIDVEGRKVTLFNNHLESIGLTNNDKQLYRELAASPDSIGEKMDDIKSFTKKFLSAFRYRAAQTQYIDSMANAIGGNIIMCGDINDTPNSYAYHTLRKGRNDAYVELGSGPGYTYRADGMWVRIDHIIYEGDFTAKQIRKGEYLYSDHYPLLVKFEWNK